MSDIIVTNDTERQSWVASITDVLDVNRRRISIRTTIRRNAYDFQSSAKVEMFTLTNGWVEVVTADADTIKALPTWTSNPRDGGAEWEAAATHLVNRLIEDAEYVLRHAI